MRALAVVLLGAVACGGGGAHGGADLADLASPPDLLPPADLIPSARQHERAAALDEFVDEMAARTAYPYAYDRDALKATGEAKILAGPDDDQTYFAAMWGAFLGIPEGHQGMALKAGCGTKLPYQLSSRFGVCGRRDVDDAIVVTVAKSGNLLGLSAGDRIVKTNDESGTTMLATAFARPVCGSSFPSLDGQKTAAAASFFGSIPSGAVLEVEAVDGTHRMVTVPDGKDAKATSCIDPLGRDTQFVAKATTLADGTAVIRVPSFVPFDVPFPKSTDPAVIDAYRMDFQNRIKDVFDTVKDAPRLVWDLRSNLGGLTLVGLAMASGMPGASATPATYCTARIADTDPVAYDSFHYATYALTPGGDFAYTGKVAILIDGLNYSAGDYFAWFVKNATSTIVVGEPTAGAFGGESGAFDIASATPALSFTYDLNHCLQMSDDVSLETKGVAPTMAVAYDPADLAAGKDTVLAAAVAALQ